ncbi:helix-turn-helix domain-containing protein [Mesorhizobium retamae]|uniref:Helix-turn-helix domain-containing protein n=1 Tax=Mesorhizobium retamae TaxID=2912854 RepID=A0ABS9QP26_9HYPH|nr:helix-turn-helix domain-containing protein [Mesorhizobium sp. IRAMC:0171]MCG7509194.1 helix-turn-helix domain-containing protein [Mesorhizobium sp. IRAMC:0171]
MANANHTLIDEIVRIMADRKITQAKVAEACGCSQSYLSKLLKKHNNVSPGLESRLTRWVTAQRESGDDLDADLESQIRRLLATKRTTKRNIIHILRGLADLA